MSNPNLNQTYANSAQVIDIQTALTTAKFLIELSKLSRQDYDDNPSEELSSITELWKFRAYTFLNRACELSCTPVHKRLVETSNGLEEAWYTWSFIYCGSSQVNKSLMYEGHYRPDLPEMKLNIESVFLGYCSSMTESQARMRALS